MDRDWIKYKKWLSEKVRQLDAPDIASPGMARDEESTEEEAEEDQEGRRLLRLYNSMSKEDQEFFKSRVMAPALPIDIKGEGEKDLTGKTGKGFVAPPPLGSPRKPEPIDGSTKH